MLQADTRENLLISLNLLSQEVSELVQEVCRNVPYLYASKPIPMLPYLKVHNIANPAGFLNN